MLTAQPPCLERLLSSFASVAFFSALRNVLIVTRATPIQRLSSSSWVHRSAHSPWIRRSCRSFSPPRTLVQPTLHSRSAHLALSFSPPCTLVHLTLHSRQAVVESRFPAARCSFPPLYPAHSARSGGAEGVRGGVGDERGGVGARRGLRAGEGGHVRQRRHGHIAVSAPGDGSAMGGGGGRVEKRGGTIRGAAGHSRCTWAEGARAMRARTGRTRAIECRPVLPPFAAAAAAAHAWPVSVDHDPLLSLRAALLHCATCIIALLLIPCLPQPPQPSHHPSPLSMPSPLPATTPPCTLCRLLNYENLTGSIPLALTTLSRLHSLDLRSNSLSGPLPPALSSLRLLTSLAVSVAAVIVAAVIVAAVIVAAVIVAAVIVPSAV
ncbi:unnamed protein product [Closterium sp. Naga37s-1]|nr:unnamed protein product [Closterium sp. Naga37s-1]